MLRKFRHDIENEPWEQYIERSERYLTAFAWFAITLAAIYIGGITLYTILFLK